MLKCERVKIKEVFMEVENEILEKAKYCLNCKNKPCSDGCPMNTDIPAFIEQIKNNRFIQ